MKNNWISVTERLPEEGKLVFILAGKHIGDVYVARLRRGISKDERQKMANGELSDPNELCWNGTTYEYVPRSRLWKGCDEEGNNHRPYCWDSNASGMRFPGQSVTHWMPIPEIPKMEVGRG